jgi:hypothetical protein
VNDIGETDSIDDWPDNHWWAIRSVLLTLLGTARRRLLKEWDCYPWRLHRVFDSRRPVVDRFQAAAEFLALGPCCLDPGFSRKLRLRRTTVADLMHPDVHRFRVQAFNQVTLSTQWLECAFASLKQWVQSYFAASLRQYVDG